MAFLKFWGYLTSLDLMPNVYLKYLMEGIATHRGQYSGRSQVLNDCDEMILSVVAKFHWLKSHARAMKEIPDISSRSFSAL